MKDYLGKGRNPLQIATLLLLVCFFAGLSTQRAFSQAVSGKKIDLVCQDEAMSAVLNKVEKASGFKVKFNNEDVRDFKVTISLKQKTVEETMAALIAPFPLSFRFNGVYVSVQKLTQQSRQIIGQVKDSSGEPLPGVNVRTDVSGLGAATGVDGKFIIDVPAGKKVKTVNFSYIGMQSVSVPFVGKPLAVTMKDDAHAVEEVVVTGIFERKKEGFTGSANKMSGDEIRKLTSGNVLNAIQMLDPGFRMEENTIAGSNPSSVPNFNMRGQSSMGDYSTDETVIMRGDVDTRPNQPLFVLDGIIGVGVTKIMDLDPAQIASITLLKDAAAMAIYGSQASNGVVVVETKAPAAGKLRVSYNGNYKVEYPDLTDYDLLHAAEKLELEKRGGLYMEHYTGESSASKYAVYANKLFNVNRGVDTYWMSQPLQTAFAHRHGLNLEGGNENLRYKLYAGINQAPGVMKETGIDGKNVSLDIRYRYKGLLISNIAYVDYTISKRTSPYGSFRSYAMLNPYYPLRDEKGNIPLYLEEPVIMYGYTAGSYITNPMYNTLYQTKNQNTAFEVRDAFRAEYSPISNLRLALDFTVTKTQSDTDVFKSANHTDYQTGGTMRLEDMGSYSWTNGTSLKYDVSFTANYNQVWNNKHLLSSYFRYNVTETQNHSAGVNATGFPNDNMDEVFLGAKVQSTTGDEGTTRALGAVATVSYTYDQRYAVDVNGRLDASSEFGSNNRFAPFWSTGLRWNLNNESWIKKLKLFDELVLRATYGVTGEQGFSAYQALQMYTYANSMRIYQGSDVVGSMLYGMGNPDLKWQITNSLNVGFDFNMFNNILSGRLEYYNKYTKNTVLDYSLPPSMGFSTIKDNIGNISNEGYEFSLRVMPYYNPAKQMNFSITANGSHNKNRIKKISNAMRARNQEMMQEDASNPNKLSRPMPRYEEGYSQSMIWTVRSLGIDPITGREVYLDRKGNRKSTWDAADQVPVGDTEPKLMGTLGLNFNWRGLSVSVASRYKFGGQVYNRTLLDKVENASIYSNVDRRAYTERWLKPGDATKYKSLQESISGNTTKASSRFVMDDNELVLNVLNLQYRFEKRYDKFLEKLGLSSASVGLYMEDLFHWSTVKVERGTDYPMSRQVSMSLNLTF